MFLKEERVCELNSPSRLVAEPERAPSVLASRTKEGGSLTGQEAFYGQGFGGLFEGRGQGKDGLVAC